MIPADLRNLAARKAGARVIDGATVFFGTIIAVSDAGHFTFRPRGGGSPVIFSIGRVRVDELPITKGAA